MFLGDEITSFKSNLYIWTYKSDASSETTVNCSSVRIKETRTAHNVKETFSTRTHATPVVS